MLAIEVLPENFFDDIDTDAKLLTTKDVEEKHPVILPQAWKTLESVPYSEAWLWISQYQDKRKSLVEEQNTLVAKTMITKALQQREMAALQGSTEEKNLLVFLSRDDPDRSFQHYVVIQYRYTLPGAVHLTYRNKYIDSCVWPSDSSHSEPIPLILLWDKLELDDFSFTERIRKSPKPLSKKKRPREEDTEESSHDSSSHEDGAPEEFFASEAFKTLETKLQQSLSKSLENVTLHGEIDKDANDSVDTGMDAGDSFSRAHDVQGQIWFLLSKQKLGKMLGVVFIENEEE